MLLWYYACSAGITLEALADQVAELFSIQTIWIKLPFIVCRIKIPDAILDNLAPFFANRSNVLEKNPESIPESLTGFYPWINYIIPLSI